MKIPLISYEGTVPGPMHRRTGVDQVLMNINVNLMKEQRKKEEGKKGELEADGGGR